MTILIGFSESWAKTNKKLGFFGIWNLKIDIFFNLWFYFIHEYVGLKHPETTIYQWFILRTYLVATLKALLTWSRRRLDSYSHTSFLLLYVCSWKSGRTDCCWKHRSNFCENWSLFLLLFPPRSPSSTHNMKFFKHILYVVFNTIT